MSREDRIFLPPKHAERHDGQSDKIILEPGEKTGTCPIAGAEWSEFFEKFFARRRTQ